MRSLDDSYFGAISLRSDVFAANGLSSTHTLHILEPAMPLPLGSKCCFCHGFVSGFHPSKASDFYAPLDFPCQHHPFTTPPGVS